MLTAFMIGMSNGMNVGETMIDGNQYQTEQQDKKDWFGYYRYFK